MPVAYFRLSPTSEFWSRKWQAEDVGRLVAAAETSYLTDLILENLPKEGKIIEAGCGLGQYVVFLRRRGYSVEGIDYSEYAVNACLAYDPKCAVRVGDVTGIGVPANYYRGYISLGVVEHYREGPERILREARRVLSDDGVLLVSVPFTNLWRGTFGPYIRAQNASDEANGNDFYQYTYSKREVAAFLEASGFKAEKFLPYDPRRLPKMAFKKLFPGRASGGTDEAGRSRTASLSRRLFYTRAGLNTFSHMLLVVARKTDAGG